MQTTVVISRYNDNGGKNAASRLNALDEEGDAPWSVVVCGAAVTQNYRGLPDESIRGAGATRRQSLGLVRDTPNIVAPKRKGGIWNS